VLKNFLIILIFFPLFTTLWGFYISIRPSKFISGLSPKDLGLEFEEIDFKTNDDLILKAWFIPSKIKKAKTIILLHGYPAEKGDVLPSLSFLNENYNLFLFDFRYLGESEGKYSTAGLKEIEDLKSAIRYLKSRGIEEVGVWGFSMGGAVAIMSAPKNPEIKVIISDSSYSNLGLIARQLYRLPYLDIMFAKLTGFWAKIFLGLDINRAYPENEISKLSIPILLIHSENDEVIPFEHALRLQEASQNNSLAEYWFKDDLIHGQHNDEYKKRIFSFFSENF